MPSKCIKRYNIFYAVFMGKMGYSQWKAIILWGEVSRKPIKQCCTGEHRPSQVFHRPIAIAP